MSIEDELQAAKEGLEKCSRAYRELSRKKEYLSRNNESLKDTLLKCQTENKKLLEENREIRMIPKNGKLTRFEYDDICNMLDNGLSPKEISRRTGRTVQLIKKDVIEVRVGVAKLLQEEERQKQKQEKKHKEMQQIDEQARLLERKKLDE